MEQKHTKEPWTLYNRGESLVSPDGVSVQPWGLPVLFGYRTEEMEANAARIVACVNACAGIPTEALEDGVIGEMVETLNFYANGNAMDRMQDGGRRAREVFAKFGIKE